MKAIDIEWEPDTYDASLPTELPIPDGMTIVDEIADYLSDEIGFCCVSFVLD